MVHYEYCESTSISFMLHVMQCNVIAFITCYIVNIVDTEARMVFFGGHPAKYLAPSVVCAVCVCVCVTALSGIYFSG